MENNKIYSILFSLFKKEPKTIAKFFLFCLILFVLISFLIPKRYNSTLKFFPNQSDNSISSINAFAQDFGFATSGGSSFPLSEIASSNIILDKIYYSTFENINGEKTNISKILNRNNIFFSNDQKDKLLEKFLTIEKLKNRLSISHDRRSNITTISISIEDPVVAKEILDLFYYELSLFVNKSINSAASYKINYIDKRSLEVERELFEAESELEQFLNANKFINESPTLIKKWNELKREVSVKETAYIVLRRELEVAKIEEEKNTLKIFLLEKPAIPIKKSYPSRLKFALSSSLAAVLIFFCYRNRRELKDIFSS